MDKFILEIERLRRDNEKYKQSIELYIQEKSEMIERLKTVKNRVAEQNSIILKCMHEVGLLKIENIELKEQLSRQKSPQTIMENLLAENSTAIGKAMKELGLLKKENINLREKLARQKTRILGGNPLEKRTQTLDTILSQIVYTDSEDEEMSLELSVEDEVEDEDNIVEKRKIENNKNVLA
ncbi:uncharacterized protein LOC117176102 [Belonocnema kinseyi]|uniref:uncharacterized protein LOC117176102 n=1 Tax=Belonocnema kinseyi TaxID=2817044 RepID=UPI00143CD706|nr:uncharacterized protein LOC117176102 [Belonocnema kinseyi]